MNESKRKGNLSRQEKNPQKKKKNANCEVNLSSFCSLIKLIN